MTRFFALASHALVLALPSLALAHPGHGSTDGWSLLHHLLEPTHALVLGSVAIGALALIGLARARRERD